MSRKNKPRLSAGLLKVSGVANLSASGTSPVMVGETPSCTATNSREFALNIVKHITRLVKSDALLAAVLGVWLCSMIAWGAML